MRSREDRENDKRLKSLDPLPLLYAHHRFRRALAARRCAERKRGCNLGLFIKQEQFDIQSLVLHLWLDVHHFQPPTLISIPSILSS